MKTAEELNALREEVETLNKKLAELTEDELKAVVGGHSTPMEILPCNISDTCTIDDPTKCDNHVDNNPFAFFPCPKLWQ